eukprot:3592510-Rhodomonas_salina.3
MSKHISSAVVQEAGCEAIGNVALSDVNRQRIRVKGGIDAVIAGIKDLSESAAVQVAGCVALCRLASDEDNRMKIWSQGGMAVLKTAVSKHARASLWPKDNSFVLEYLPKLVGTSPLAKVGTSHAKVGTFPVARAEARHVLNACAQLCGTVREEAHRVPAGGDSKHPIVLASPTQPMKLRNNKKDSD